MPQARSQCTPGWTPGVPTGRISHAMAYDSIRNVIVMFGGFDGNSRGETWEFANNTWTLKSSSGPTPREGHAMAFDASRQRVVLFGGFDGVANGQTWEWNGTAWTNRAPAGTVPSARYNHAMAYDSARMRVVLFGGFDGTVRKNDTWEYNSTANTWAMRSSSGPTARTDHAMAYDVGRARTVLFGGNLGTTLSNETWEWNGTAGSWTRTTAGDPGNMSNATLAYDTVRSRLVLFGGYDGSYTGETWERNGTAWSLRSSGGPAPRYSHTSAFDVLNSRTLIFAGIKDGGYDADTWAWNGTSWTLAASGGPSPRMWSAMAYDSVRAKIVLFGGRTNGEIFGDTFELDGRGWMPRAVAGPSARYWHAMAFDSARGETVLFGGNDGGRRNDTWVFNGTTWTDRMITGPSSRDGHAMAFDSNRNVVVLFGGDNGVNNLGDTWEYNGVSWTQRVVAGPSARHWHAMCFDTGRNRTVLQGGIDESGLSRETWEWDGTVWIRRSLLGPSGRSGSAMAYDSARARSVLFAGYDGVADQETWEWNGTAGTWQSFAVTATTPSERQRHTMAFDTSRGACYVFSGTFSGTGQFGDTHRWGPSGGVAFTQQPASQSVCTGQPVTFTVVATGSGTLTYQWRKNGVNIPGATMASYMIASVQPTDAAAYSCVVTNTCGSAPSANATLTVSAGVSITQQPQSQSVCTGQPVTFTVVATGPSLTYQWRRDTVNIPGATSSSYMIASVQPSDAGAYSVVLGSSCGSTTSNDATLSLSPGPGITQQPQSIAVCSGQPAQFSVTADGTGLSYQWRKNTVNIPGAVNSALVIAAVLSTDAGSYDVIVSSSCGSTTSNAAALTVLSTPTITQHPQSAAGCTGRPTTFTVVASGSGLTYQWRKNTVNIPGATSSSYTIASVVTGDAGSYDVVVRAAVCPVTSNAAVLTVFRRADCDCDGSVNNFDVDAFLTALIFGQPTWSSMYGCDFLCANDIDGDGVVTNFDVDPFIEALNNGG